jgi:hypothetical protein
LGPFRTTISNRPHPSNPPRKRNHPPN